jgi:4-hydroxybenzoate polyprenyltransferase
MAALAARIMPTFQLTRLSLVFGAVADAWFVILYTRGDARYNHVPAYNMPLLVDLVIAAVLSVGLFAFAGTLNDLLDQRHDATFSPDRPLPSGRIRAGQAVVIAVGSLLAAIAAAIPFGNLALIFAVLAATGILFYDTVGKHLPAMGITIAGLIHVAHMMVPNYDLTFTPPVWLIFTHVLAIAGLVHVLEDKRPRFGRVGTISAVAAWILWSAILLGLGIGRGAAAGFEPSGIRVDTVLWPAMAVAVFMVLAWRKIRSVPGPLGAERLRRYGAMWHAVYGAAWFAGLGRWSDALAMGVIAFLGIAVMTILRELAFDDPGVVGYRA